MLKVTQVAGTVLEPNKRFPEFPFLGSLWAERGKI